MLSALLSLHPSALVSERVLILHLHSCCIAIFENNVTIIPNVLQGVCSAASLGHWVSADKLIAVLFCHSHFSLAVLETLTQ